jgi:hypothetical protein
MEDVVTVEDEDTMETNVGVVQPAAEDAAAGFDWTHKEEEKAEKQEKEEQEEPQEPQEPEPLEQEQEMEVEYEEREEGPPLIEEEGWEEYYDEMAELPYYYNTVTGEARWEMPEELVAAGADSENTGRKVQDSEFEKMSEDVQEEWEAQWQAEWEEAERQRLAGEEAERRLDAERKEQLKRQAEEDAADCRKEEDLKRADENLLRKKDAEDKRERAKLVALRAQEARDEEERRKEWEQAEQARKNANKARDEAAAVEKRQREEEQRRIEWEKEQKATEDRLRREEEERERRRREEEERLRLERERLLTEERMRRAAHEAELAKRRAEIEDEMGVLDKRKGQLDARIAALREQKERESKRLAKMGITKEELQRRREKLHEDRVFLVKQRREEESKRAEELRVLGDRAADESNQAEVAEAAAVKAKEAADSKEKQQRKAQKDGAHKAWQAAKAEAEAKKAKAAKAKAEEEAARLAEEHRKKQQERLAARLEELKEERQKAEEAKAAHKIETLKQQARRRQHMRAVADRRRRREQTDASAELLAAVQEASAQVLEAQKVGYTALDADVATGELDLAADPLAKLRLLLQKWKSVPSCAVPALQWAADLGMSEAARLILQTRAGQTSLARLTITPSITRNHELIRTVLIPHLARMENAMNQMKGQGNTASSSSISLRSMCGRLLVCAAGRGHRQSMKLLLPRVNQRTVVELLHSCLAGQDFYAAQPLLPFASAGAINTIMARAANIGATSVAKMLVGSRDIAASATVKQEVAIRVGSQGNIMSAGSPVGNTASNGIMRSMESTGSMRSNPTPSPQLKIRRGPFGAGNIPRPPMTAPPAGTPKKGGAKPPLATTPKGARTPTGYGSGFNTPISQAMPPTMTHTPLKRAGSDGSMVASAPSASTFLQRIGSRQQLKSRAGSRGKLLRQGSNGSNSADSAEAEQAKLKAKALQPHPSMRKKGGVASESTNNLMAALSRQPADTNGSGYGFAAGDSNTNSSDSDVEADNDADEARRQAQMRGARLQLGGLGMAAPSTPPPDTFDKQLGATAVVVSDDSGSDDGSDDSTTAMGHENERPGRKPRPAPLQLTQQGLQQASVYSGVHSSPVHRGGVNQHNSVASMASVGSIGMEVDDESRLCLQDEVLLECTLNAAARGHVKTAKAIGKGLDHAMWKLTCKRAAGDGRISERNRDVIFKPRDVEVETTEADLRRLQRTASRKELKEFEAMAAFDAQMRQVEKRAPKVNHLLRPSTSQASVRSGGSSCMGSIGGSRGTLADWANATGMTSPKGALDRLSLKRGNSASSGLSLADMQREASLVPPPSSEVSVSAAARARAEARAPSSAPGMLGTSRSEASSQAQYQKEIQLKQVLMAKAQAKQLANTSYASRSKLMSKASSPSSSQRPCTVATSLGRPSSSAAGPGAMPQGKGRGKGGSSSRDGKGKGKGRGGKPGADPCPVPSARPSSNLRPSKAEAKSAPPPKGPAPAGSQGKGKGKGRGKGGSCNAKGSTMAKGKGKGGVRIS